MEPDHICAQDRPKSAPTHTRQAHALHAHACSAGRLCDTPGHNLWSPLRMGLALPVTCLTLIVMRCLHGLAATVSKGPAPWYCVTSCRLPSIPNLRLPRHNQRHPRLGALPLNPCIRRLLRATRPFHIAKSVPLRQKHVVGVLWGRASHRSSPAAAKALSSALPRRMQAADGQCQQESKAHAVKRWPVGGAHHSALAL